MRENEAVAKLGRCIISAARWSRTEFLSYGAQMDRRLGDYAPEEFVRPKISGTKKTWVAAISRITDQFLIRRGREQLQFFSGGNHEDD